MLNAGKMETMTRVGFAARGIMYVLIGYLALRMGRAQSGSEVLGYLDSGIGPVLLVIMAIGFFGYGLWRLTEALLDSEGHGNDAKGTAVRAGGFVSGLIHFGLGLYALKIAFGDSGGGGGNSTEGSAAAALTVPGGAALLMVAAAAIILSGLYQLVKSYKADFLKHLLPRAARMSWVEMLGRAGYAARGIVFAIMGWFLWRSASAEDPSRAGDMGEALASLPSSLQFLAAGGLLLFGLFSLVEAVYRRINDPRVLERLSGRARGLV